MPRFNKDRNHKYRLLLDNVNINEDTKILNLDNMSNYELKEYINEMNNIIKNYKEIVKLQMQDIKDYYEEFDLEIKKTTNYYDKEIKKIINECEYYKNRYNEFKHIEELSDIYLCNLCLTKPKNLIYQPCNHFINCSECYQQLCNVAEDNSNNTLSNNDVSNFQNYPILEVKCPVCRQNIDSCIDVFC